MSPHDLAVRARCRWIAILAVAGAAALGACSTKSMAPEPDRDAVAASWDHYLAMLKLVNSDSVASVFTDSAEMYQSGTAPIHGRDAVRAFMAPFDGHAHVDSVTSTSIAINVYGDVAYQWGTYHQVAHLDAGAPGTFNGRFVVEWSRGASGSWRIRRLLMQPAP